MRRRRGDPQEPLGGVARTTRNRVRTSLKAWGRGVSLHPCNAPVEWSWNRLMERISRFFALVATGHRKSQRPRSSRLAERHIAATADYARPRYRLTATESLESGAVTHSNSNKAVRWVVGRILDAPNGGAIRRQPPQRNVQGGSETSETRPTGLGRSWLRRGSASVSSTHPEPLRSSESKGENVPSALRFVVAGFDGAQPACPQRTLSRCVAASRRVRVCRVRCAS